MPAEFLPSPWGEGAPKGADEGTAPKGREMYRCRYVVPLISHKPVYDCFATASPPGGSPGGCLCQTINLSVGDGALDVPCNSIYGGIMPP